MPLSEKGKEILKNMRSQYGKDKGESVFYASENAGEITGVEHAKKKASELRQRKKNG